MFRVARDRPSPLRSWAGLFLAWLILAAQPARPAVWPDGQLAPSFDAGRVICHNGSPNRSPDHRPHPAGRDCALCALCYAAFGAGGGFPAHPALPGPALRDGRPAEALPPSHDAQTPVVGSAQARAPPLAELSGDRSGLRIASHRPVPPLD